MGSPVCDPQSMLRICALLQSVRALYAAHSSSAVRGILEKHLLSLILELIPADGGAIVLDNQPSQERGPDEALMERANREKTPFLWVNDDASAIVAPLLVRGEMAGALYLE